MDQELPGLVLLPNFAFADLEIRLTELGWTAQASTMVRPPILPGEPEIASWRKHEALLTYSFNPVVRLRVIHVSGDEAAANWRELAQHLPALELGELETLLESSDVRRMLLGLWSAAEMKADVMLPRVEALLQHPEPHVASAAQSTYRRLGEDVLTRGLDRLAAEKRARPDSSVLFPRLGDAVIRRQAIRSIPRDIPPSEGTIQMLRAAFQDPDWEVRVSAMILSAALCPDVFRLEVKRLQVPTTGYPRLFKDHLLPLREFQARYPSGKLPEPLHRTFTVTQSESGHPSCVVDGIQLFHVPEGSYPVGDQGEFEPVNPYRIIDIGEFWISNTIGEAAERAEAVPPPGFRLPSAEEWEIAMRGADARLFPWGNSIIRPPEASVTWCGASMPFDALPEWTSNGPLCAGAMRDGRPFARSRAPLKAWFRLVRTAGG